MHPPRTPHFTAALTALALSAPVLADTGPWYAGIGAGTTRYGGPDGSSTVVAPGTLRPVSFSAKRDSSDRATAWTLDAGYRFNPYFALEGGYVDFGSAGSTFTTTSPSASYALTTKVRGEVLDAVGTWPLSDRFALFAKAGLLHYKSDIDTPLIFAVLTPTPTFQSVKIQRSSTTDTAPDLGVGASLSLSERFSLRASITYFRGKDSSHTSGLPVANMPGAHLRYLQLIYQFG